MPVDVGVASLASAGRAGSGDPHGHRPRVGRPEQIGPSSAGLAVQATIGLRDLPIGPWPGLGVLAVWAAGAMLLAGCCWVSATRESGAGV